MSKILQVKDIMTAGWIATISIDDDLAQAAKLFGEYNYDGFPVIDKDKKLRGVLTAYEMISDSAFHHLTGMQEILEKIKAGSGGMDEFEKLFEKLKDVKVKDIMNSDPLTATPDMGIDDLAKDFARHHRVNPIPVIDGHQQLVGVVSRYDLMRFFDIKYLNKVLVSGGDEVIAQKLAKMGAENK